MRSQWDETRTFFPLFLNAIDRDPSIKTIAVVGAADGKFVLPLLKAGYDVTAIEVNSSALYGALGVVRGKATEKYETDGLVASARAADVHDRLTIVDTDIRAANLFARDALWTSCSWHYSMNHDHPLERFVSALKRCVRPGGLIGAEYFMPVSVTHIALEHYLEQGEIWRYLDGWLPRWEAYTPPFIEEPHLGQPERHVHRMGFVLAASPID
ncbi:hypothetical protein ACQPYE_08040 [Actinosynnema sp. CA-299493]